MMKDVGQKERLLACLAKRGFARARELKEIGVDAKTIARALDSGEIFRASRGLYQLPCGGPYNHEAYLAVAKRAPRSVICLSSALSFHGLIDLIPRKIWIAIGANDWAPKIDRPAVRVTRFREPYLSSGVEIHNVEGIELRVHSVTKAIADSFRLPNFVFRSDTLLALKTALAERRATPAEIADVASENGVFERIRPCIEALTAHG